MSQNSDRARYRLARQIVIEALERPAADRSPFLEQRCGADHLLRREVDWLLAAAEDDSEDDVPERFQAAARSALQNVSLEIPLPRNYRLLKRLGQGSAGIVYLAERVDGNLYQPVAFKLLHFSEAGNEDIARRFADERAILARLNHPWIARLIDGGLTADNRPFLATEFVDGVRIDQWAAGGVPRREIIAQFMRVCEAVDYAHRHMIIHRDLKPANILITRDNEPRLLDFGIAGLLDGDSRQDGLAHTFTPGYASPEQVEGDGLSAASDVYSLGVVLHELLTGQKAFHESNLSASGADTPVPGRDHSPLPEDLAAIVRVATAKEPAHRYASVRALVDELERHRSHRPVSARQGGFLYRAHRFLRRHRAAALLALLITGLLAGFLVNREMQLERIAYERDRAETVTAFMSDLLTGADSLPTRGGEVSVRDVLDLGAKKLQASESASADALGQIYLMLARAYNALGLGERALPLLESASQALKGRLPDSELGPLLAEQGAAFDSAGRAAEAIAADRQAMQVLQASRGASSRAFNEVRVRYLRNQVNIRARKPEIVIPELEQIVAGLQAAGDGKTDLMFQALSALAAARLTAGQTQRALAVAQQARDLAETLYQPDDPRRLGGRHVYATVLMQEDPARAAEMLTGLVADHQRLVGAGQRLANTIGSLGVALSRQSRPDEAMEAFEQAADMIRATSGTDHYLYRLSTMNLGLLKLQAGDASTARRLISDILPALEDRHSHFGGIETFYLASALEVLGGAHMQAGDEKRAREDFERALEVLSQAGSDEWSGLRQRISQRLAVAGG